MFEPHQRISDIAAAVADGQQTDWDSAESNAADDTERALIHRLRIIAEIGRAHAALTLHDPLSGGDSAADPLPGARSSAVAEALTAWGSLRILETVGRGRFGTVYRAWDPTLDREVALKLLRRRDREAGVDDTLIVEEGRLMARVRHPNVTTIYGAQRIDGWTGLWMEFIEGRTLEAELRERGPFDAEEITRVGIELCHALAAVHEAGLVHRDVKAQNVLRDKSGRIVLGDFGTGRELDETEVQPAIAGTPAYLAPEIFRHAPATARSDIYSLGALLFHLATMSYPVDGRSLREIRDAHAQGRRRSVTALRPGLPEPLVVAITRALDPEPARRFENAAAMKAALDRVEELAVLAAKPASLGHSKRLALAAGIATSVAGAALWYATNRDVNVGQPPASQAAAAASLGSAGTRAFRQMSRDPELAGPGVPSPDGRLLSYVDTGTGELALYEVASGRRRRVTATNRPGEPRGWAGTSRFSADGVHLIYVWSSNQQNRPSAEIRTVPVSGGDPRTIWRAVEAGDVALQHWAGDDGLILASLAEPDGDTEVVVVSTATGDVRARFEVARSGLQGASLSPDGRYIAYDRPDAATRLRDIYIRGIDDPSEAPLIQDASSDHSPVWTPDGRHLLFLSDRSGTTGLWAQSVEAGQPSGRPIRIEPNLGWAYPMGGLTKHGALFFRRQMGTRDVYVVDVDPATAEATGEPTRASAEAVGANGSSDWSPDGRQLAFFRRRDDRWSLVIKSFDGRPERELARPDLVGIARPRWEWSGRWLLFKAVSDNRPGLRRVDLETGEITTVMERFFNEYELLPQIGTIIYSDRGSRELIRRDLATGQESVIHRLEPPWTLVEMGLSHSGERMAYTAPSGGKGWSLRIVDLASPKRAREILHVGPDEFISAYAWTLDDQEVIIKRARNVRAPENDESRLWAVNARTGQARLIGLNFNGLNQLRMSPDGRRLSFDGGWPVQEVWALENVVAGLVQ